MLFHTPEFCVFLAVLLALFGLFQASTPRKAFLLAGSYVFYMWWNPAFILLILYSTTIDFFIGRAISATDDSRKRKRFLMFSLCANLGMLAFFKYTGFLEQNLLWVMRQLGYQPGWTSLNIILPVGISFFTFQSLSYVIDVYRKDIPATKNPLDYYLFVSFFPHLVAGPIIRPQDFLPQLRRPIKLYVDSSTILLFIRGLVKKLLIADQLSPFVDGVFADPSRYPSTVIILATLAFSTQIYCDFSGYSDMAIAVTKLFGIWLPLNFNLPYFATSPSDFWRRWHISLSSWLRNYLYIPLGGNRDGEAKTYRNNLLTMLLGGLWHGASWNFVTWGFLHGLALICHRVWTKWRGKPLSEKSEPSRSQQFASWALMQWFVLLTWITFRITDFPDMLVAVRKFVIFEGGFGLGGGVGNLQPAWTVTILVGFWILHLCSHICKRHIDEALVDAPLPLAVVTAALVGLAVVFLWPSQEAPFIYFQF